MKKYLIYGFFMALIGGFVSVTFYKSLEPAFPKTEEINSNNNNSLVHLISPEPTAGTDYITAAEATIDGVVHIKVAGTIEYSQQQFDPLQYFFYGNGGSTKKYEQPIQGSGSGVIISTDGYIVTNNHVINNADKIEVTLNNKKSYTAELVGHDPTTDIAVLKIDADELKAVSFGNSDQMRVGEWVLAVGNPFNLTSTVTAGIVSAKGRDINILSNDPFSNISSIESFIQTDAVVNPGNSGGALVNTKGELIGINTAIKSNTGSYTGYSFAIPSNIVKKVAGDIIKYGSAQRAYIGIQIQNIDQDFAKEKGIDDLDGVYVAGLAENGSAKNSGIKIGDIIKSVNGTKVNNANELQAKVGEFQPGDLVEVQLIRDGKSINKSVTLKNQKGNTDIITTDNSSTLEVLGARLENANSDILKKVNLDAGVLVAKVYAGKMQQAGIQDGFIIAKVDNSTVNSVDDLIKILQSKEGGVLIQGVYPNGQAAYYAFGM